MLNVTATHELSRQDELHQRNSRFSFTLHSAAPTLPPPPPPQPRTAVSVGGLCAHIPRSLLLLELRRMVEVRTQLYQLISRLCMRVGTPSVQTQHGLFPDSAYTLCNDGSPEATQLASAMQRYRATIELVRMLKQALFRDLNSCLNALQLSQTLPAPTFDRRRYVPSATRSAAQLLIQAQKRQRAALQRSNQRQPTIFSSSVSLFPSTTPTAAAATTSLHETTAVDC